MKVIVFGDGWLGNKFAERFNTKPLRTDILDLCALRKIISSENPDWVVNAAGKCGSPNIDWCEASDINRKLTTYSNAYGPAVIEEACHTNCFVPFLHLSSGCIWGAGDDKRETDTPNPNSHYAKTKVEGEKGLLYESTLVLRLRMPFDGTLSQRNLITKLSRYPFVLNVQNSLTCTYDLLDAAEFLMKQSASGTYHIANSGTMSGVDVMTMYQEIVQPRHKFMPVTMQEMQAKELIATGRSNVTLNCDKLREKGFEMPTVQASMERCLQEYAKALALTRK